MGDAELAEAEERVGHGVDAIAQVQHQLRPGLARLPEVVPQDRPTDLPTQTAAIEVVGHQHAALQQRRQGWRNRREARRRCSQLLVDPMHGGIGDRHGRVDHRAPLLLDLPVRREQQQGDLHDPAELAGAGGLQIHHREALGTARQEIRQRPWLAWNSQAHFSQAHFSHP